MSEPCRLLVCRHFSGLRAHLHVEGNVATRRAGLCSDLGRNSAATPTDYGLRDSEIPKPPSTKAIINTEFQQGLFRHRQGAGSARFEVGRAADLRAVLDAACASTSCLKFPVPLVARIYISSTPRLWGHLLSECLESPWLRPFIRDPREPDQAGHSRMEERS